MLKGLGGGGPYLLPLSSTTPSSFPTSSRQPRGHDDAPFNLRPPPCFLMPRRCFVDSKVYNEQQRSVYSTIHTKSVTDREEFWFEAAQDIDW